MSSPVPCTVRQVPSSPQQKTEGFLPEEGSTEPEGLWTGPQAQLKERGVGKWPCAHYVKTSSLLFLPRNQRSGSWTYTLQNEVRKIVF